MSSLESRLAALAEAAFPPTPDIAVVVTTGLSERPNLPSRRGRGALALAGALVLGGGATVAAVELSGPESVEITRVERLPSPPRPQPALGITARTLKEASALAGFDVRAHETPREIHVDGGVVTLVHDDVVVTEAQGIGLEKIIGPDTGVRVLRVGGARAVFFTGGDRRIFEFVRPRLTSAPTLVVEAGRILIRIEGAGLARARAIATALLRSPAP